MYIKVHSNNIIKIAYQDENGWWSIINLSNPYWSNIAKFKEIDLTGFKLITKEDYDGAKKNV